jgi:hypothetical protein
VSDTDDTPATPMPIVPPATIVGFFQWPELACKDGTPYPDEWKADLTRGVKLMSLLNTIRKLVGGPVEVVSGYRSPAYNESLIAADAARGLHGVASGSQHVEGRAADISAGVHASPEHLHGLIFDAYVAGRLPDLGGMGLYPDWVHVDVRERQPVDHLAQWGLKILSSQQTA